MGMRSGVQKHENFLIKVSNVFARYF